MSDPVLALHYAIRKTLDEAYGHIATISRMAAMEETYCPRGEHSARHNANPRVYIAHFRDDDIMIAVVSQYSLARERPVISLDALDDILADEAAASANANDRGESESASTLTEADSDGLLSPLEPQVELYETIYVLDDFSGASPAGNRLNCCTLGELVNDIMRVLLRARKHEFRRCPWAEDYHGSACASSSYLARSRSPVWEQLEPALTPATAAPKRLVAGRRRPNALCEISAV
jgi:hypothetical protein